jgi:hypothetical protein
MAKFSCFCQLRREQAEIAVDAGGNAYGVSMRRKREIIGKLRGENFAGRHAFPTLSQKAERMGHPAVFAEGQPRGLRLPSLRFGRS